MPKLKPMTKTVSLRLPQVPVEAEEKHATNIALGLPVGIDHNIAVREADFASSAAGSYGFFVAIADEGLSITGEFAVDRMKIVCLYSCTPHVVMA